MSRPTPGPGGRSGFAGAGAPEGSPPAHVLVVGGTDVEKRLELVEGLSGEFRVTVAGPVPGHRAVYEEAGVDFVDYPLRRGFSPLADVRTLVSVFRLVRRLRPDVVHAFATKPAVWARIAARLAGAPAIVGTLPGRGSLFWASGPRVRVLRAAYRALQRVASRCSDLTFFYNESDAETLVGSGVVPREQAAVVPGSGVPTDVFDPERVSASTRHRLRGELGAGPDDVVVTMVGRVIRTKGVLEFAGAARRLAREGVPARLVLVGPDDPRSVDRLEEDERRRVEESVLWLGERSDVRDLLGASDVFVLPSYGEGIPRAVMEAASLGLPVVATRVPGCRDVVEDGTSGLLVPAHDVEALTDAVRSLVEDAGLRSRLGDEARRTALDRFDTGVIVNQIAAHYRRLTGRTAPDGVSFGEPARDTSRIDRIHLPSQGSRSS